MLTVILIYICLMGDGVESKIKQNSVCDNVFTSELCVITEEIRFHRLRITSDPSRRVAVKVHAASPNLTPIHMLVRFTSLYSRSLKSYHSAVLFGQADAMRYAAVTQDAVIGSGSAGSPKIAIITRSLHKVLSHDTVHVMGIRTGPLRNEDATATDYTALTNTMNTMRFTGISPALSRYDAILTLDPRSDVWHEYNTLTIERTSLRLQYDDDGEISEIVEPYSGLVRLRCNISILHETGGLCVVQVPEGEQIAINGVACPHCRLVIDLDSDDNLLPVDIYNQMLQTDGRSKLTLSIGDGSHIAGGGESPLPPQQLLLMTNSKMAYEPHESNDLIIGVDLIHMFPKMEFSPRTGALHFWYFNAYQTQSNTHEAVQIVLMFINFLVLLCIFNWGTTYNYYVLNYILRFSTLAKQTHYFAYKQVAVELSSLVVTLVIWFLCIAFSENSNTNQEYRKLLFILFSLFHFVCIVVALFLSHYATKEMATYYTSRCCGGRDKSPAVAQNLKQTEGTSTGLLRIMQNSVQPVRRSVTTTTAVGSGGAGISFRQKQGRAMGEAIDIDSIEDYKQEEGDVIVSSDPDSFNYFETWSIRSVFFNIREEKTRAAVYKAVVRHFHDPVTRMPTQLVIMRNLALISLLSCDILLILNFSSESINLILLLIVIITAMLLYYQFKYLIISVIFLLSPNAPTSRSVGTRPAASTDSIGRRRNRWFMFYLGLVLIATITLLVLSFEPIFFDYFYLLNSAYNKITVIVYVGTLLIVLIICSLLYTKMELDLHCHNAITNAENTFIIKQMQQQQQKTGL